jgi:hypothetical protein
MPTSRGRNHDDAASSVMPRRAKTKPKARARRRHPDVHRQLDRRADADRGAVDRADHGLEALVDAQRVGATAVAVDAVGPAELFQIRLVLRRLAVERVAARREVGAGAERLAGAGDDHGAHRVVGVGLVEERADLLAHLAVVGVELFGAVQRDRRDAVGDVVAGGFERRQRHRRSPREGSGSAANHVADCGLSKPCRLARHRRAAPGARKESRCLPSFPSSLPSTPSCSP